MRKFAIMMALSVAVCYGSFATEDVLKLSKAGDFPKPVTVVEADGEKVFEVTPRANRSTKYFIVDMEKTYLLKGSFRNLSQEDVSVYFGFEPLDSNGNVISPQHVNCAKGTETELAEAVNIGDTSIKLKDGAGWKKAKKHWFVAFNAKDDLSDLPNRDLSPNIDSASVNEVMLSRPIERTYPVGTQIRAQLSGNTFLYTAGYRKTSNQWQEFSGKIQGKGWRLGTAKARILVYPRPNKNNLQAKIQFKDISVEILD